MKKRLSALVVGAGVAGLFWVGGPSAQACDSGPTRASGDVIAGNPATGGEIYGAQTGDTSGQVGTAGETGYIEAGGNETDGAYVQGSTSDGSVNGRTNVSSSPSVCVNDTPVP